jgi:ankyrin repeat protein
MKLAYSLIHEWIARMLLISLFLQSCKGNYPTVNPTDKQLTITDRQGERSIARVNSDSLASTIELPFSSVTDELLDNIQQSHATEQGSSSSSSGQDLVTAISVDELSEMEMGHSRKVADASLFCISDIKCQAVDTNSPTEELAEEKELRRKRREEKGKEKEETVDSKNYSDAEKGRLRDDKSSRKFAGQRIKKNKYCFPEAIERMDMESIQTLIGAGSQVNFKDKNGSTALHLAIKYMDANSYLQFLLQTHAIPNLENINRNSLVYLCLITISNNMQAIVRPLIEISDNMNMANKQKQTPLHIATQAGNEAVVKLLVEKGAHIDCKDVYGNLPLHYAAQIGNLEIVEIFINKKEKDIINARNKKKRTALYLASEKGHREIVDFLIRQQADIRCISKNGNSALHYAAKAGQMKVLKLLLEEHKWFVNHPNLNKETALHMAAKKGQAAAVQYLITRGFNIDEPNINGCSPLALAIKYQHSETINLLKQNGANINNIGIRALHWAASKNDTVLIERLIENGASVEIRDESGQTPLQYAIKRINKQAFKTLERLGADTNVRNKYGCTSRQQFLCNKYVIDPLDMLFFVVFFIFFILLTILLTPIWFIPLSSFYIYNRWFRS